MVRERGGETRRGCGEVVLRFGMWDYVNDVGRMMPVMLVGLCYAPDVGCMHKEEERVINSNRRRPPLNLCHGGRWVG